MRALLSTTTALTLALLAHVGQAAAQTPIPPSPSPSPSPSPAATEPVVSLIASVGLGGGTYRLGPFGALAQLDLDVRASRHWSLGARGGFLAAGEPDGRGADGRYAAGTLGYRAPLSIEREVFVSVGVGWIGISGYESAGRGQFDDDTLLVIGRLGALWHESAFLAGASLDCLASPDEGVSVVLAFLVGLGV